MLKIQGHNTDFCGKVVAEWMAEGEKRGRFFSWLNTRLNDLYVSDDLLINYATLFSSSLSIRERSGFSFLIRTQIIGWPSSAWLSASLKGRGDALLFCGGLSDLVLSLDALNVKSVTILFNLWSFMVYNFKKHTH
jgi:hypothetical protein